MDNLDAKAPDIYTGLEDKKHASRRQDMIELGWVAQAGSEFPEQLRTLNIDMEVTNLAEKALSNGERSIVVIDVGSGYEGIFLNSFLDPNAFPQLHDFLKFHEGLTVRVIGATGAKPGGPQGVLRSTREIKVGSEKDSSKIVTENYGYTVTRAHTLAKLLDQANIPKIDAAFSTFGVGYFTPANFEQCLIDVADRLVVGGSFHGISYDHVPAGFRRTGMGNLYMAGWIKPEHPLKKVFNRYGDDEEFERFHSLSRRERIDYYINSIDYCVERGLILEQEAVNLIRETRVYLPHNFVRHFDDWATPEQIADVTKFISTITRHHPFLSVQNWDQLNSIVTEISNLQTSFFQKAMRDNHPPQTLYKNAREKAIRVFEEKYRSKYRLPDFDVLEKEVEAKREQIEGYIETSYAMDKRTAVWEEIDRLKTESVNANWNYLKAKVKSLDPLVVAEFWDWTDTSMRLAKLLINKFSEKTTEAKQQVLRNLSKRQDLQIFFNSLNFYIRKL